MCADASERAFEHARRADDVFERREIVEWLAIVLFLGPTPASEAADRCRQLLEDTAGDPVLEVHILGALAFLIAMQGEEEEAFAGDVQAATKAVEEAIRFYELKGNLIAATQARTVLQALPI